MTKPISQSAALVTGAGHRIGQAIAIHLALNGFDIALHYHRSKTAAQKTADHITENGGKCSLFKSDLSHTKETQALIDSVLKKYKHLNLIINNASIFKPSTLLNNTLTNFDKNTKISILMQDLINDHVMNLINKRVQILLALL